MSKIQTITTETIRSVSIAQALELVPFGETTLRALMDDGRLPFSRISALPGKRGRVAIRVSDIDKLLTATAVKPRAKSGRARAAPCSEWSTGMTRSLPAWCPTHNDCI
jgi:hypothetical protein